MRLVVTGATGMIGRHLVRAAHAQGHQVVALSRSRERGRELLGEGVEVHQWAEPKQQPPPPESLQRADAVLHLLGEPVAQRWNPEVKREIRASRVDSTQQLVSGLVALSPAERPGVLVSQSATGYYGPRGDEVVDEGAAPGGDFLSEVVVEWEGQAQVATEHGLRVAMTRTGVVLASDGGALATMLPPFRLGVGGPVAGGRQYVPWIHLADVTGALLQAAQDPQARGPINVVAPNPVTNAELAHALGRVLRRPAVLPVPGFAVSLLYGEMASIVTTGQRVVPLRLQELGYRFGHPELEPALRDVLG